jgi:hypothetical protein
MGNNFFLKYSRHLETFNQGRVLGLFPFDFQKLALHLKMCLHSLALP